MVLVLSCFLVFELKKKVVMWTHKLFPSQIGGHIFKTVFPEHFFLFSVLSSRMSKNICTLRHKVRNAQNIPP